MRKPIYVNTKNKYGNSKVYVLIDQDGDIYPFNTKHLATMFMNQNLALDFTKMRFDSKLEFGRFKFLKELENKGIISELKTQVDFELIPKQKYVEKKILKNGTVSGKKRTMRGTKYISDFTYIYNDELIVEDTKSAITRKKPDYRIKKKLMLLIHNILVKEVDKSCLNTL